MIISEGRYYKTRDGRKVGPAKQVSRKFGYWSLGDGFSVCHENDGSYLTSRAEHPNDLISEWPSEGPIRTRTVTEIVSGIYGDLLVGVHDENSVQLRFHMDDIGNRYSASDIRALIATMTQLADALEEE